MFSKKKMDDITNRQMQIRMKAMHDRHLVEVHAALRKVLSVAQLEISEAISIPLGVGIEIADHQGIPLEVVIEQVTGIYNLMKKQKDDAAKPVEEAPQPLIEVAS